MIMDFASGFHKLSIAMTIELIPDEDSEHEKYDEFPDDDGGGVGKENNDDLK